MIDFLVNLALNLALKIHQKSTQEAPKINKKSIKNNIQDMIPFFIDSLTLRVVAVDPVQVLPNYKQHESLHQPSFCPLVLADPC